MNDALIEDKKIVPFDIFKEKVAEINDKFNETWLETEYNTAYGQSQMIEQWSRFEQQADILPYLQYVTGSGEATCDICAPCDGVTLPIGDSFWEAHTPLQHFNCACMIIQEDENAKQTSSKEANRISEEITPLKHGMFMSNSGKSGIIFNKDTPYFNVPKQYVDFAKTNFGLPISKKG
jgi:Phage Mu protein F like protein